MKREYKSPEMIITTYNESDVIMASGIAGNTDAGIKTVQGKDGAIGTIDINKLRS